MKRIAALCVTVLSALAAEAQTSSTKCQAVDATVMETVIERRLIGCGEGFPHNLLWHLDRADSRSGALDATVTRSATGKGAVVYVVDTGIMAAHDEFARAEGSAVIAGIRFPDLNPSCPDGRNAALDPCFSSASELYLSGHGTGTASVVAGRNTGVAPDAKLVSVFALLRGDDTSIWTDALDAIVAHAWDPASPQFETAVITMSLVPGFASAPLPLYGAFEAKMRAMIEGVDRDGNPDPAGKKFLFVVLAGNVLAGLGSHCLPNGDTNLFPATLGTSIDGLITVGGIDENNRFWERSCGGSAVDLLGPATNMFVASPGGRDHYRSGQLVGAYPLNSGTSFATPYVAGLAALILEKHRSHTPAQIESMLKAYASFSADGTSTAFGRVGVFIAPYVRRRALRR